MNTPSDCLFRNMQHFCNWPQWFTSVFINCLLNFMNKFECSHWIKTCRMFFYIFILTLRSSSFSNSLRILWTNDVATLRKRALSKCPWSTFNDKIIACLFFSFVSIESVVINFWKIKPLKVCRKQYWSKIYLHSNTNWTLSLSLSTHTHTAHTHTHIYIYIYIYTSRLW